MFTFTGKKYKNLTDGDIIVLSTGDGNKLYGVDVPLVVMGIDTGEVWITEVTYDDEGTWTQVGESSPLPVVNPEFYITAIDLF
jgi:hypothetical protein